MTRKTYCGNLLWQSGLTLLAQGLTLLAQIARDCAAAVYMPASLKTRKVANDIEMCDKKRTANGGLPI